MIRERLIMYKGSIDIGNVNKNLKITFNLVIIGDSDNNQKFNNNTKTINKFTFNNSEYLKFHPRPFLTLDISRYQNNQKIYDPGCQVNINRRNLFTFIQRIKLMIDNFKEQDLFFIKNKQLQLNKEKAISLSQVIRTNDKAICLMHSVISDEERVDIQYEGIILMINNVSNSVLITYDELLYMYYLLTKVDMEVLSMELINAYLLTEKNLGDIIKTDNITKTISEVVECEPSITTLPKIQKPNTIPDI